MNDRVPVVELRQTFAVFDDSGRRWTAEMRFRLLRDFGSDLQSTRVSASRTLVPAVCPTALLIAELRRIATKFAGQLQQSLTDPEMIAQIQRHIDDELELHRQWEERRAALANAVGALFQPLTDASPTDEEPDTP